MRHRGTHILLTIAGAAGIAGIFLPFAWSVSPLAALHDELLWMLAVPFFLPVAVAAVSTRWIVSGSLSKPETAIAYVASSSAAGITLVFIGRSLFEEGGGAVRIADWLGVSMAIVMLILSACLLVTTWRTLKRPDFRPLLALQAAYLVNAAYCLIEFFGFPGWQAGAYVALVTAIAYLLQIILVYPQTHRLARPG